MSDHLTLERTSGSDNAMSDVEQNNHGKLHDPTGQYASAYARTNNANQGSSPSLDSFPSPQEPFRKRPRKFRSQIPLPEPNRGHETQCPTSSPSQASFVSFESVPFAEGANGQGPAVASVVNRYYLHSQYSGTHYDNIGEFEQSPRPLYKQAAHHFPFTFQHRTSHFEQSPPPPSVRPFHLRQPTSFQQQQVDYKGYRPAQELAPYNSSYADQGREAMAHQRNKDYESRDDDSESGIFVWVDGYRVERAGSNGGPLNSRKRFSDDTVHGYERSEMPRPQASQRPDDEYFNNPGKNLHQSRFSGGQNNWGVNQMPVLIPEDEVTDAALLKRGLKRGNGAKVCKRGYGANDPENIAIVNMFEKDRMSFEAIMQKLNADRVENGKDPSLSANGVQTRYNRNAPILFSAEGKDFVPLGMRKRGQRMDDIYPSGPKAKVAWNDHLDTALVMAVKDWENRKWENVAALFRQRTGIDMDAAACAHRHHII